MGVREPPCVPKLTQRVGEQGRGRVRHMATHRRGGRVRPGELDESLWKDLLRGLALAEYSLVLGAGASMGCKNGLGEDLLSGFGLRDRLLEHYEIPGGHDQPLRQVYDVALGAARARGVPPPAEVIRPWFTGCSVASWYANLVTIPWRVIWNLNIDDVVANAYRSVFRSRARQELRIAAWEDPWTAQRDPLDKLRMVHLHGAARSGNLVFGSLDYLAAASSGGAAHAIFADEWAGGLPAVVVGASLDDELDLAGPLLGEAAVDPSRPSVIVRPGFTDFEEFRLKQAGLIPVRMRADEFFEAVSEEWESTLASIEANQVPGTLGLNPLALSFLRSFRQPVDISDRWHDFYAGDEPSWGDLRSDLDFPRTLPGAPTVTDLEPAEGLRVYAFHGELSGTTTAEMRFLEEAVRAGFKVLEYCGEGKFDPNAVHWMAKQGSRALLRVPRLDDFADAAGALEALCAESGAPVVLVTSLRSSRLPALQRQLGDALRPIRVSDHLPRKDVLALLEKLGQQNRLNVLLDVDEGKRVQFIAKTHHGSLIDSLAAITRGRTFSARYVEAYGEVTNPVGQRILDLVLIASEARLELGAGILARAAGVSASDLRGQLSAAPLQRLIQAAPRGGISARHWGLAARASTQVLTVDRRYSATIELVSAAAPYVHPTTISQRTREVSLVAKLMDAQRVVAAFGRVRAATFYDELEATFSWNSRFWEQRALAELESPEPRYERAEAWAREAVTRHEDGLSLNTLATVLLRRSVSTSSLDVDTFFEGLATVDEARRVSLDRVTEHPYVTALSYLRRGRALANEASLAQRIDQVFNFWRLEVESSRAWAQTGMRRDLEGLIQQYLRGIA